MTEPDSYEVDIPDETFIATMKRSFSGWYVTLSRGGLMVDTHCFTAWGARFWIKRSKLLWERDIRREERKRVWIP